MGLGEVKQVTMTATTGDAGEARGTRESGREGGREGGSGRGWVGLGG